jgi:hypothetical protein
MSGETLVQCCTVHNLDPTSGETKHKINATTAESQAVRLHSYLKEGSVVQIKDYMHLKKILVYSLYVV